jgi:GNAT superfamily N-acetyltransferase
MNGPAPLDIRLLPAEAATDAALMRQVAELINMVYAAAERGQWLPGATRTSAAEITDLTRAGEIVVARLGDDVVGAIRVRHFDASTGETGMLAVDPAHRELGIGSQLRHFVTDLLRERGLTTLRIELLVPRDWHQPSKRFMAEWNERSGYEVVRQGAFENEYPNLAPLLATPCDFVIYHKAL